MKRFLLLLLIVAAFAGAADAQTLGARREVITKTKVLDEKTVVKDSTGTLLSYKDWQEKLSMGQFTLRLEDQKDENSAYVVVRMTASQRAAMMARMQPPNETGYFTNGEKMASFRAYDMGGKRVELKDLLGKVVVLNFWFVDCPPCRREIPELNTLVAGYANNPDVVFIAIALDKRADIKTFIKENPYNYRHIASGREISSAYKVTMFPTNVVVDKTGTIRFNAAGFAMNTPQWIKKSIDESLTN